LRTSGLLLLCILGLSHARSGEALHRYGDRPQQHRRYRRSAAARNAFKREHPCPSTGMPKGTCSGYVIDHINPLECGGADAPFNMQWQTIAEGKAKDKWERNCRLR
jgi:5-methylcytosine-specific restriction endonuclease McrA